MSSHMFEEVENTCDRIGIIKLGKLITIVDPKEIRRTQTKTFKIFFAKKVFYITHLGF
mgnify:CR=1 FL=1